MQLATHSKDDIKVACEQSSETVIHAHEIVTLHRLLELVGIRRDDATKNGIIEGNDVLTQGFRTLNKTALLESDEPSFSLAHSTRETLDMHTLSIQPLWRSTKLCLRRPSPRRAYRRHPSSPVPALALRLPQGRACTRRRPPERRCARGTEPAANPRRHPPTSLSYRRYGPRHAGFYRSNRETDAVRPHQRQDSEVCHRAGNADEQLTVPSGNETRQAGPLLFHSPPQWARCSVWFTCSSGVIVR